MGVSGFDDRNIEGMFYGEYAARFEGSWASTLGLPTISDSAEETYGFLGANPAMREWIGARQAAVLNKKQFTIRNSPYEASMVIKETDLNRDKTGLLKARMGSFAGDAGADHWEDLVISLINSNGLCYDGQNFFDTDHSFGDSGTQTNALTATEVPSSNVGTATAPTPLEMANVILEMTAYMLTYKNDKGRDVNGQARKFVIMVSTAQLFSAAMQAVGGIMLSTGSGTVDNPLKGFMGAGFSWEVKMVSRLTSATAKVRMFRADGALKPFILQEEQPLATDLLGKGSDFYFDNKAYKFGVDAIRAAGYGLWEHAAEVTLT